MQDRRDLTRADILNLERSQYNLEVAIKKLYPEATDWDITLTSTKQKHLDNLTLVLNEIEHVKKQLERFNQNTKSAELLQSIKQEMELLEQLKTFIESEQTSYKQQINHPPSNITIDTFKYPWNKTKSELIDTITTTNEHLEKIKTTLPATRAKPPLPAAVSALKKAASPLPPTPPETMSMPAAAPNITTGSDVTTATTSTSAILPSTRPLAASNKTQVSEDEIKALLKRSPEPAPEVKNVINALYCLKILCNTLQASSDKHNEQIEDTLTYIKESIKKINNNQTPHYPATIGQITTIIEFINQIDPNTLAGGKLGTLNNLVNKHTLNDNPIWRGHIDELATNLYNQDILLDDNIRLLNLIAKDIKLRAKNPVPDDLRSLIQSIKALRDEIASYQEIKRTNPEVYNTISNYSRLLDINEHLKNLRLEICKIPIAAKEPNSGDVKQQKELLQNELKSKIDDYDVSNNINGKTVTDLLGTGESILHDGCEQSKSAREKFIDALVEILHDGKTDFKGFPTNPNDDAINMVDLFGGGENGKRLLQLYKDAIEEESKSRAFRDAVFLRTTEYRAGETWATKLILWVAGPSACGKSVTKNKILDACSSKMGKTGKSDGNYITSIDGAIERETSQIRQLVLQAALQKGYPGVRDLDKHTKHGIKKRVQKAALASPALHLLIPNTFSNPLTINKIKKYSNLPGVSHFFSEIVGSNEDTFRQTVERNGDRRAWAHKYGTPAQPGTRQLQMNNVNIGCESKKYHKENFEAGKSGSEAAANEFYRLNPKNYIKVTSDWIYVICYDEKATPPSWRYCRDDEKTGNIIGLTQRQFDKWGKLDDIPHPKLEDWLKSDEAKKNEYTDTIISSSAKPSLSKSATLTSLASSVITKDPKGTMAQAAQLLARSLSGTEKDKAVKQLTKLAENYNRKFKNDIKFLDNFNEGGKYYILINRINKILTEIDKLQSPLDRCRSNDKIDAETVARQDRLNALSDELSKIKESKEFKEINNHLADIETRISNMHGHIGKINKKHKTKLSLENLGTNRFNQLAMGLLLAAPNPSRFSDRFSSNKQFQIHLNQISQFKTFSEINHSNIETRIKSIQNDSKNVLQQGLIRTKSKELFNDEDFLSKLTTDLYALQHESSIKGDNIDILINLAKGVNVTFDDSYKKKCQEIRRVLDDTNCDNNNKMEKLKELQSEIIREKNAREFTEAQIAGTSNSEINAQSIALETDNTEQSSHHTIPTVQGQDPSNIANGVHTPQGFIIGATPGAPPLNNIPIGTIPTEPADPNSVPVHGLPPEDSEEDHVIYGQPPDQPSDQPIQISRQEQEIIHHVRTNLSRYLSMTKYYKIAAERAAHSKQGQAELQHIIDACDKMSGQIQFYNKFLAENEPNNTQHINIIREINTNLTDTLTNPHSPTGKIAYFSDKSVIIEGNPNVSLDAAITAHLQNSRMPTQSPCSLTAQPTIQTTEQFTDKARISETSIQTKRFLRTDQVANVASVQRMREQTFVSEFHFDPAKVKNFRPDDYLKWAVVEVENFRAANPDSLKPITIKGNMPPELVKHIATYCAAMGYHYENRVNNFTPGKGDIASLEKRLEKNKENIYGRTAAPLATPKREIVREEYHLLKGPPFKN